MRARNVAHTHVCETSRFAPRLPIGPLRRVGLSCFVRRRRRRSSICQRARSFQPAAESIKLCTRELCCRRCARWSKLKSSPKAPSCASRLLVRVHERASERLNYVALTYDYDDRARARTHFDHLFEALRELVRHPIIFNQLGSAAHCALVLRLQFGACVAPGFRRRRACRADLPKAF